MIAKRFILTALLLTSALPAHAHRAMVLCNDNGDNTITCQGGFSDGSSASGVSMRVESTDSRILMQGRMGEDSAFTFTKPRTPFVVVFDAGADHRVTVPGRQISR
ncbi:hypothetical protein OOT00_06070 [Desulfobotulus sp. H1]|uniref:Uncharacterized protein n=1 Tax=Desulfobotulus pelophilus TaxID=2823377 RepID=A0ABT3N7X2_9BACT|nr:hypothetical protein [Desulfobotulus pelophilus]MCW7753554.1 hypothetical protein [Desulfobotulus pelophilus]